MARSLLAAATLALCACTTPAPAVVHPTSCLRGPVPATGRRVADEMIHLTRRELQRAERSSPLVHARILEALPPLSPDLSDRISAPDCRAELAHESEQALRKRPLVYSRLLVARVRLTPDAETLLELAARGEDDFTDYQLAPGEPGPPPPRPLIRYLALGNIPVEAVMFNVPEGKRLLTQRVRASTDDREQLLLHSAAHLLLSESLQTRPARDDAKLWLLHTGLPDLRRRLMNPADRVALELIFHRLAGVGTLGTRFGVGDEARALVGEILAAKGELPATRGVPGAARDLADRLVRQHTTPAPAANDDPFA